MSDMRKILENFDKVQKKTLNEAFVVECPPDMPTMETGGDLSINITGDAASMSQILRALAGIQGGRMSMGTAMQDDPRIPGRDDVEGDTDLNQGIIGTTLGGALGAGLGLATGAGPMATTLGALSGAAAGDSLTDKDIDDPRIPGRDDVEGDTDLQADIGGLATGALDALKGFGAQAADAVAQGSQAAGDAIATGAKAAGDAAASTGLGQRAIDAMGQASDWAADKGASIGSKIGGAIGSNFGPQTGPLDGLGSVVGAAKGAELGRTIGKFAPAAAATGAGLAIGSKALGGTGDKKARNRPAENSPSEEYMSAKEMMAGGNDIHSPKHPKDIRIKDASAYDDKAVDEWENEPSEEYSDHDMMLNKLSGGINGKKKMYKAAQRGDNAMAVEMKARLEAKLAEKKNAKPDFLDMDKDGDKKEPMKKAVADKKAKGPVKETSQELNDMLKFLQRLL